MRENVRPIFLSCLFAVTLSFFSVTGCGSKEPVKEDAVETAQETEETTSQEEAVSLIFEDGKAQPILEFSDLRNPYYTNEDSDILRYCVYVETDFDTDADGNADLVKVLMQVPRAAAKGDFKAATIYDPTPYGAGTVEENGESDKQLYNPKPFDYDKLY